MRAGRHQHRPTDEQRRQVTLLSGYGLQQEQIATFINVAPKTLRLRYRRELDLGVVQANAQVAASLFAMAVKDRVPSAAIFWLKARAGWKETTVSEQTSTQTLQFAHLTAAQAFSEQLQAERAMAERAIEGSAVVETTDEPEPTNLWAPATE